MRDLKKTEGKAGEKEMDPWGTAIEITAVGSSFRNNKDNRK